MTSIRKMIDDKRWDPYEDSRRFETEMRKSGHLQFVDLGNIGEEDWNVPKLPQYYDTMTTDGYVKPITREENAKRYDSVYYKYDPETKTRSGYMGSPECNAAVHIRELRGGNPEEWNLLNTAQNFTDQSDYMAGVPVPGWTRAEMLEPEQIFMQTDNLKANNAYKDIRFKARHGDPKAQMKLIDGHIAAEKYKAGKKLNMDNIHDYLRGALKDMSEDGQSLGKDANGDEYKYVSEHRVNPDDIDDEDIRW